MGAGFTGVLVLPDQTGHGENVLVPPVEIGARIVKTEGRCILVRPVNSG